MILKNNGLVTDKYLIPPFELRQGEIIVINLMSGMHFGVVMDFLKDVFEGKRVDENVKIVEDLKFVEHFKEPKFRKLFCPISVGEYLKKYANINSKYSTMIYEDNRIVKKTKVNQLQATTRKQLSLFATLSKTNNIIFDLLGQDPYGADKTYKIIQDNAKNGGSAIFLDYTSDMKNDCTKYIEIEWKMPFIEDKPNFKIVTNT